MSDGEACGVLRRLPPDRGGNRPRVVRDVVPAGFDGIVAVLHDAEILPHAAVNGQLATWREIAEHLGLPYDPAVMWAKAAGADYVTGPRPRVQPPADGTITRRIAHRLLPHLYATGDVPSIDFLTWDAYGTHPLQPLGSVVWYGDRYWHERGGLDLVIDRVDARRRAPDDERGATERAPNIWLPSNQRWALISERRCLCTYVTGVAGLIEAIVEDPELDTVRTESQTPLFTEAGLYTP
jgi:hypothetical protein